MTLTASSYATPADLAVYLPDVSVTAQSSVWQVLLAAASRFIDAKCHQYFYAAGWETKRFDGDGSGHITTKGHPFYGKSGTTGAASSAGATSLTYISNYGPPPIAGDQFVLDVGAAQEQVTVSAVSGSGPYTLTVGATQFAHPIGAILTTFKVSVAYFENQPIPSWISALSGDGIIPPSNFFLWPRNPGLIGSAQDPTARKPFYGLDLAHIPLFNTLYLPVQMPGYLTIAISAWWGWPVVPDLIKDLTCKLAARAWHSRDMGWSDEVGSPETGLVKELMRLDPLDEYTLISSGYVRHGIF